MHSQCLRPTERIRNSGGNKMPRLQRNKAPTQPPSHTLAKGFSSPAHSAFLQDVHVLCVAEPRICWTDEKLISKNVSDVRHFLL